jgi:Rieske Fe-S protein
MSDHTLRRRAFLKLCAAAGALVAGRPALLAQPSSPRTPAHPVRLVHPEDRPLRRADLMVGRSYVFHYPYAITPCFLIDLGRPAAARAGLETDDGREYRWQGGVGPGRSVVAFSAICAHRMSYPTREVSFISYRHGRARYTDLERRPAVREQVIYCCSEGSAYDPAEGARVLGGPAPQPLAAVDLQWDQSNDSLTATGTYGGQMFDRFFEQFGFRLELEYGGGELRKAAEGTTPVWTLEDYCANTSVC